MTRAVLFDFTGVIANIRPSLIGEDGPDWVIEPVEEVTSAIPALRASGVTTCLVSNNDRDSLIAAATNIDFDKLFDVLVFSSDVGFNKPHHRIFLHAIERVGVAAEDCLFIDDVARNVDAAIACGMQGVIADSPQSVVDAIKIDS